MAATATPTPTNQSGARSRPARVAPSLYQPPAVRAAELRQTQSVASAAPASRATARPRDNSKDDRRNKRPDQQRYIPRPLRSELGSCAPQKSEAVAGDCRKVSPEAPSKSSTRTRHSEIGTASSRMPTNKSTESNKVSSKDPPEISAKVDDSCSKRDKVSEKVRSRPILIRKRYSAPVQLQSANSSEENSVDGLITSQKIENNQPIIITQQNSVDALDNSFHKSENSRENSVDGLNSPQTFENNLSLQSRENSVDGSNSSTQKTENTHSLSSQENSVDGINSSQKTENNHSLSSQENLVDGFNQHQNTKNNHSLSSQENSVEGFNLSQKTENNHSLSTQANSVDGFNSTKKTENNHSLSTQANSVDGFNSTKKTENNHSLSSKESSVNGLDLSQKTENNYTLSSQENSVDGFNSSQKSENSHSSPNQDTPKPPAVENGFKHDETSKDGSIISQVSLETGDSCSNFATDTNSMSEDYSNQGRLSNGVDSSGKFESETISTDQDSDANEVDVGRMEVDNSAQCEQVVPNLNTDNENHPQVCPEIKDSRPSCEVVSSQVIKTECLSASPGNNRDDSLSFSDDNRGSDDKSITALHQEAVQTAKRIKTEECDDWETLYDDDSALVDPVIIEELGESVGKVKITTASSDYRCYQSVEERSNNGECILEIYGFPAEFKTRDLMTAFAGYRNRAGFYIKWVDDTHALAVFNSPLVADEVLMCDLPFVKTRPLRLGLPESRAKARNLILPPAVRPKTCPALAKRLVSGALGLRLQTDKKAREHEKLLLKEARDQKRLAAKLKEAAWEGTLTSNMQS